MSVQDSAYDLKTRINPFESPQTDTRDSSAEFRADDKTVAARESSQAVIAAILFSGSAAFWIYLEQSWFPMFTLLRIVLGFVTLSCLATTLNHISRWRLAWRRLPLVVSEEGIRGRFDKAHGEPQEVPWSAIHDARLDNSMRLTIIDRAGNQLQGDYWIVGRHRRDKLLLVLEHYRQTPLISPDDEP